MFDGEPEALKNDRFQWVAPFLGGLFLALFIAASVFAAYILKVGPFSVPDRQAAIESAINDATGNIRRQIDAEALNQDALSDPAASSGLENDQAVSIGLLRFGTTSLQASAVLAAAEARGQAKCAPTLTALDPNDRAALTQASCVLTAPPSTNAPVTPDAAPAGASIALSFSNGKLAELVFRPAGIAAASASGDAPTQAESKFDAPPAAGTPPAETPPASTDAPPPS